MERINEVWYRELLVEDGWKFVKKEGELELWKKFNFYVWFDPRRGFSSISIGDPPEKPPV
jgi:hypothetical protein